ncbi:hypothetical protein FQA39_LY15901 [Lamprigera yunnana]|nr:hypothetical protein FQA39_LY15901 [Lamprigera yunnana]
MTNIAKKKTSVEQLNILVDFLGENQVLLHGKTTPSEADRNIIDQLWEEVSGTLNSCGSGPIKLSAQWKKTFIDWKCHTRKKARDLVKMHRQTGGGEADKRGLTTAEEKLMALLSWVTVKGIPNVAEPGLENEKVEEISAFAEAEPPLESTPLPTEVPLPAMVEHNDLLPQKRTFLSDTIQSPSVKRTKITRKDKSSTLENAAKAFAEGQTATVEILNKILGLQTNSANTEQKKKELELKEFELKIRFVEARNKEKELALREKELALKEKEVALKEKEVALKEMYNM